jgi:hypothetical protein
MSHPREYLFSNFFSYRFSTTIALSLGRGLLTPRHPSTLVGVSRLRRRSFFAQPRGCRRNLGHFPLLRVDYYCGCCNRRCRASAIWNEARCGSILSALRSGHTYRRRCGRIFADMPDEDCNSSGQPRSDRGRASICGEIGRASPHHNGRGLAERTLRARAVSEAAICNQAGQVNRPDTRWGILEGEHSGNPVFLL